MRRLRSGLPSLLTALSVAVQANPNLSTDAGPAMQPAATWFGHATTLVQAGGLSVLTDPVFSERVSPLSFVGPKRAQPPGQRLDQLPRIDLVLISHNHYDHLDVANMRALNAQAGGPPLFIVPLGLKAWLADMGVSHTVELDSSRDFADIRARLTQRQGEHGVDLAQLPVGAYEPRWFMATQHINPAEGVQIHLHLHARRSLAVRWGTFELSDGPRDQPPQDLAAAAQAAGLKPGVFEVVAVGETWRLPVRRE